jgi:hypothetical protein
METAAGAMSSVLHLRSWATGDAAAYCEELERSLSENALLSRFGMRLDPLWIKLKAQRYDPKLDQEAAREREALRETGVRRPEEGARPGRRNADDKERDRAENEGPERLVYSRRDQDRPDPPRPLDDLEPQLWGGVILGDPGSGKTTWLKALARRTARAAREALLSCSALPSEVCLPVFLHLRGLGDALLEGDGALEREVSGLGVKRGGEGRLNGRERLAAAILAALDGQWKGSLSPRVRRALWEKLAAERGGGGPPRAAPLLLCLDSWDEAAGERRQQALTEALRGYAATSAIRIFLTSRVAGYRENPLVGAALAGQDGELRLCGFDPADRRLFVERFFRDAEPGRGGQLLAQLERHGSTAGVAESPLMTTLICLAFRFDAGRDGAPLSLPLRRVELYERLPQGVLGKWLEGWAQLRYREAGVDPRTGAEGEELKRRLERLEGIDRELAAWTRAELRERRAGLGAAPETLIQGRIELLEAIAERFFPGQEITRQELNGFLHGDVGAGEEGYLARFKDQASHPVRAYAEAAESRAGGWKFDLISQLCADGGLQQVGDSFLFLHLTLQEHLVARVLARRRWAEIGPLIDRMAWLPAWKEVVILLAGKLDDPKPLIELLADPRRDDVDLHRQVLAAEALAEVAPKHQARLAQARDRLCKKIVDESELLYWRVDLGSLRLHWAPALRALLELGANYRGKPLSEYLPSLEEHNVAEVVAALGAAAATPEVLVKLAVSLPGRKSRGDKAIEQFARSARALGAMGAAAATPAVLEGLLNGLRHRGWKVREAAADALTALGPSIATPEVVAGPLSWITDEDAHARLAGAIALGRLGATAAVTPEHVARLLASLSHDDWFVRFAGAEALAALGAAAATPEAFVGLLELLLFDRKRSVQFAAGKALLAWGRASEAITDVVAMLPALLRESSQELLMAASRALGAKTTAAAALQELISVLARFREEAWFGWRGHRAALLAVHAFGAAASTPEVLAALLALLRYESGGVDREVLWAITPLGPAAATPEVLAALLVLLRDKDWEKQDVIEYSGDRARAAGTLARLGIGAATPEVLHELLARLLNAGEKLEVQKAAADTLQSFPGMLTPEMLARLLPILYEERSQREQRALAFGVASAAAATAEAGAELLARRRELSRRAKKEYDRNFRLPLAAKDSTYQYLNWEADEALGTLGPGAMSGNVLLLLAKTWISQSSRVRLSQRCGVRFFLTPWCRRLVGRPLWTIRTLAELSRGAARGGKLRRGR